jgi:transcriptional regulator with XRE-family HTH domain
VTFGELLKELRGNRPVLKCAKNIGVSTQYWYDLERGARNPPHPTVIAKIAATIGADEAVLQVAAAETLGGYWVMMDTIPLEARPLAAVLSRGASAELWERLARAWKEVA